jgi:hypothetical protein
MWKRVFVVALALLPGINAMGATIVYNSHPKFSSEDSTVIASKKGKGTAPPTPKPIDNAENYTVEKGKVDLTMNGATIWDHLADCANNPVCRPLLEAATIAIGVPTGIVEAAKIAWSKNERRGEEHFITFQLPAGYQYCGAEISFTTVSPLGGDKVPTFEAASTKNGVGVYATTPRLNDGRRSMLEVPVTIYGVRDSVAEEARKTGRCKAVDKSLVNCRGWSCQRVVDIGVNRPPTQKK